MLSHTPTFTRHSRRKGGGFTLIEASMAMIIIGVGVIALLELLAAGTMSNSAGTELTTAVNLANNIHEITVGLPYRDPAAPGAWGTKTGGVTNYNGVMDFNGDTFQPPLDCRRQAIANYANWAQKVTVQSVSKDNVTLPIGYDPNVPTARVTVSVLHNGKQVYQTSWLAVAPDP